MKKEQSEKFLHDNMSAEMIAALDARYGKSVNEHENESDDIVAKKQKIADFYKSLDSDERALLRLVIPITPIEPLQITIDRISRFKKAECPDFESLIKKTCERTLSHGIEDILKKFL
jgi:hypothetical protein